MYLIIGLVYILFILVTMFLLVRDKRYLKKNKADNEKILITFKDKKIAILIILCTMLIYYIIGCIFKTDIFNVITVRKNGASVSFIGIILVLITSMMIGFMIDAIRKKREKK